MAGAAVVTLVRSGDMSKESTKDAKGRQRIGPDDKEAT